LPQPYLIGPLNSLLESVHNADSRSFIAFVEAFLRHVMLHPDSLQLFFLSETSCPLLQPFAQLIVTRYWELGDVCLQLILLTATRPPLLAFVLNSSPIVPTIVALCAEAVEKKSMEVKFHEFLAYFNAAVARAPAFGAAFAAAFRTSVINRFVLKAPTQKVIASAVYIVASNSAPCLLAPLLEWAAEALPGLLQSDADDIAVPATRFLTLLFECVDTRLPPAGRAAPICLDFMGLITSEWFVRSEINDHLQRARLLATMSLSSGPRCALTVDAAPFLPILLRRLVAFFSNSMPLNLALTEFFAAFAAARGGDATFFALCADNDAGLHRALADLCAHAERRIGKGADTVQAIERAYVTRPADAIGRLVVLLEFLKELHAIAQSKNLLRDKPVSQL
jgi:hypothetical protein